MAQINRRKFLERAALIGAALSTGALAAGCNSGGGADCSDVSALSPAELETRTTNGYVERSTVAAQSCENCALFTAGAAGACGGCSVVPGPIEAAGNCNLWVAGA